jgi:integrase/recombinase XerD
MLTIYRRHKKSCEHRGEGRKYRRCRCPIWVDGFLGGVEMRESLDLRDWVKAQERIRDWEAVGAPTIDEPQRITIESAVGDFLQDAEARNLREPSLYKYRLLFRSLEAFAGESGFRFIDQLDLAAVRRYRASWPDGNLSALKKLERLRAFFRFAYDTGWIQNNPAKKLKNPKVTTPPTLPFSQEQMIEILAACEKYTDNYGRVAQENAKRLRAFVLVLRYAGLRIRDTVTLPCDRLAGNKLFLYTAKTGVPVWCPVPDFVVASLESCPKTTPSYFFWTGESKPKSAVGDWQRSLRKLFRLAGIPDGHAHRFRDTFAIELLLAGVPLERVAALLGHQSVKVTERHYAPWVLARQEQLEADVRRTWRQDTLALRETKGTPEVHGKQEIVN